MRYVKLTRGAARCASVLCVSLLLVGCHKDDDVLVSHSYVDPNAIIPSPGETYEEALKNGKGSSSVKNLAANPQQLFEYLIGITNVSLSRSEAGEIEGTIRAMSQSERELLAAHLLAALGSVQTAEELSKRYAVPDGVPHLQFLQFLMTTSK